ncbi:phosphonate metabolism protein/1,5-bisphosphokinase (PRPP-forming) PhnN [Roseicella aquatilis]|uniref:Ribose 1,5-bisphosphate phosphokinase PhnN n=1 Tax=Roseicella aquatilis TaxID=2527868 RepID=A0A4R4DRG4_9PROT|nr:phosphonate metabolism protein/1,5-bisphosphokinase (PRPP-forming) PhnN [Roseicella aquatilis]TCZ64967.1 phosphonate metabolism protein/1,5-bisphosphokinase (PRPP-forming) PhnN [Roseicella aquatilis]
MAGHPGGGFVLVVGPSGAGKDTLIGLARQALADEPRVLFPTRSVTRPASAAEAHDTLAPKVFEAAVAAGQFCLWWRAHGLGYGISAATETAARRGAVAVCNVSRTVLAEARQRLPGVTVVEVTAAPGILARRLAARGRAEDGDLMQRLTRQVVTVGPEPELVIVNDTAPGAAAERLLRHIRDRLPGLAQPGEGLHHPRLIPARINSD